MKALEMINDDDVICLTQQKPIEKSTLPLKSNLQKQKATLGIKRKNSKIQNPTDPSENDESKSKKNSLKAKRYLKN